VQSTLSSRRILYKTKPKPSQETRKTKAIKPLPLHLLSPYIFVLSLLLLSFHPIQCMGISECGGFGVVARH
jgi:hypothetical protein